MTQHTTHITALRRTSLRASQAETQGQWHIVVQCCLICLEGARAHQDPRAVLFFSDKLANAYLHMGMLDKARTFETSTLH
jgi:hypothetical protein